MTTTVINLFGGSGVGKSTVAALLFARMKILGLHVELVREYVKLWAWSGRQVRKEDQIYLLGKQSAYESMLYGKVDYIVTDSPILLAGVYAEWHNGLDGQYVTLAANSFIEQAKATGEVVVENYILERDGEFDMRGRWESEEQARGMDVFLRECLEHHSHSAISVGGSEEQKVQAILSDLGINT
jgi:hypothetical protein